MPLSKFSKVVLSCFFLAAPALAGTLDIEGMRKQADELSLHGKPAEAQQLYEQLLPEMTRKYGENSPELVPILTALGSLQESAGDHATAMTFYNRALKINEKKYGPYSPAVASNLHLLGRSANAAGNRDEADKHYRRALSILLQDPSLAASKELRSAIKDYGDLLKTDDNSNQQLIKDFKKDILNQPATPADGGSKTAPNSSSWQKQSEFQLRASNNGQTNEDVLVAMRAIPQPSSDRDLAPAYKVMSDTLYGENHYGKGEDQYQRMIAIDVNALGPHHPAVANDLSGLAQLYFKQKRYADAVPLFERALAIYDDVYGTNNSVSLQTCVSLANSEFRSGNLQVASELYRRALSQPQLLKQTNSVETARILNEQAYLYFQQGKLPDALTFYQWALDSTEGAAGKKSPMTAACLQDYAEVLRSAGRTQDAQNFDGQAQAILSEAGANPRKTAASDK